MRQCIAILLALAFALCASHAYAQATTKPAMLSDEQRSQLEQILQHSLANRGSWISIHAAEALIALDRSKGIVKALEPQADVAEAPYRIGMWRVLARVQPTREQREEYVGRIRDVLLDPGAQDHVHAMEALAKLNEPIDSDAERQVVQETATHGGSARPFALWRLAQEKNSATAPSLIALLRDPDATTRARAAYILAKLAPPDGDTSEALQEALADEPIDSPARPALIVAVGGDGVRQMAANAKSSPAARYAAAMSLAEKGNRDDQPCLWKLVNDPDDDVRVAAAFALLKLDQESPATTVPSR